MSVALHGRLVSQAKQEYAGRCPWKGTGDDRFHWWQGANNWWCRQSCPDCPGEPCPSGGMRGWFDDGQKPRTRAVPRPPRPPMSRVYEFHHGLGQEALDYLAGRGIRPDTATKFLIGQNCRRLTIPCIVNKTCYGIKKRWLGEVPEAWIARFVMEPGSQAKSLFNWDRLASRRRWGHFLVTESVMDVMVLEQLGIPATCPFGGGSIWSTGWNRTFSQRVGLTIVVADRDENKAGESYARAKVKQIPRAIFAWPPEGYTDLGEAHENGVSLHDWLKLTLGEHDKEAISGRHP